VAVVLTKFLWKSLGVVALASALSAFAATPQEQSAAALYHQTRYDQAIKVLQSVPEKDRSAEAWELLGKSLFMNGDFKKAGDSFEKALELSPDSSDYNMWIGRVYGRRAESGNPLTAPGYASRARKYFERAVELNPRNGEALGDLFEYYLEAPGFLGGGADKAAALVDRLGALDPAERFYARAKLAEKRRAYGDAEQQLRRAAEAAPMQVGRLIDLARFLAKQGRIQESDATFLNAYKVAPHSPKLMFHQAQTYIETRRNLDQARDLLNSYLNAHLTPDDPPREEARKLLKLARNGD
jgi:tetratricopeptide (TPR) repeat protein